MKYILIGLGNPGAEYENTRHNTGRLAVSAFEKGSDLAKKAQIIVPSTFMNLSGKAVKGVVKSKKAAENLVVFRDDLDLPLGRVKMTFNRGTGGHKGAESIKRAVGTEGFIQIKIGISPATPKGKIKKISGDDKVQKLILSDFKPAEKLALKKVFKKINEGLEILITDGREAAMNFLNTQ
ncbi:MAG: aminoacyl-tRNA hydrolase [Candidatus Pacebacteria bacterium]|nr:aminoacyl-tRNA hydrolase [Candidatus Paceibacterota bacterium]